jgi:mannosylglycerate hydrolase
VGLGVEPADVVLSAVKTAEDGDGIVVRVFNAGAEPVQARLHPRFPVGAAHRVDLEERPAEALLVEAGSVTFPLVGGQIASVRLTQGAQP